MKQDDSTRPCPICGKPSPMLVDIKTETIPRTDAQGRTQYYSLSCEKWFSAEDSHTDASLPK